MPSKHFFKNTPCSLRRDTGLPSLLSKNSRLRNGADAILREEIAKKSSSIVVFVCGNLDFHFGTASKLFSVRSKY